MRMTLFLSFFLGGFLGFVSISNRLLGAFGGFGKAGKLGVCRLKKKNVFFGKAEGLPFVLLEKAAEEMFLCWTLENSSETSSIRSKQSPNL